MVAFVNHGRWMVRCLCGMSHLATTGVCLCGKAYAAEWPDERDEIERALRVRPLDAQNWEPGESVALLDYENTVHGVTA